MLYLEKCLQEPAAFRRSSKTVFPISPWLKIEIEIRESRKYTNMGTVMLLPIYK